MPLSIQGYTWVLVNFKLNEMLGIILSWTYTICKGGGRDNGNWNNLRLDGPLGSMPTYFLKLLNYENDVNQIDSLVFMITQRTDSLSWRESSVAGLLSGFSRSDSRRLYFSYRLMFFLVNVSLNRSNFQLYEYGSLVYGKWLA